MVRYGTFQLSLELGRRERLEGLPLQQGPRLDLELHKAGYHFGHLREPIRGGVGKIYLGHVDARKARRDAREQGHLGDLYAESGQTLQGSFSAVSKPNFASK